MTESRTVLPRRGFVLLVLLTVFWGANWPIIKTALEELPVLTFRAICLAGGAVIILALSKLLGHSLKVPRHQWPDLLLVGLFNITLWHVATGYGVDFTASGRAAIIAYTMPVWTVPLGFFILKERVSWRRALSLALGTAGLVILLVTDPGTLGGAPTGPLLLLGGAMVWALGTILQKRVTWEAPTTVLVGWQYLICGVPIFIAAGVAVDYGAVPFPSTWPLLSVIYNVLIAFVFCYYAYYEIVRLFPVGIATVGMLATPVVGLFSGALLLSEPLGWAEYSALVLVVFALGIPVFTRPRNVIIGKEDQQ
jgi:drug/metabolite transporter (DMT)-like permease